MTTQLAYLGAFTLAAACPVAFGALAAAEGSIAAQLSGTVSVTAQLNLQPPSLVSTIELVTKLLAQLEAALELEFLFLPPTLTIAFVADLAAALELELQLLLQIGALFGVAGIYGYAYNGTVAGFGPAISGAIGIGFPDGSPASSHMNALVLAAVSPAAWAALVAFFGGILGGQ